MMVSIGDIQLFSPVSQLHSEQNCEINCKQEREDDLPRIVQKISVFSPLLNPSIFTNAPQAPRNVARRDSSEAKVPTTGSMAP